MLTYSKFRPTGFDPAGAFLPDRQDWLVMPVGQNRDSDALSQSNFASALEMLGGESETVEVHRFGHWGPGWFEIIIIDPRDSARVKVAEEIDACLADYPILDESDFSRRENEEYQEAWEHGLASDFSRLLGKALGLSDVTLERLWDSYTDDPFVLQRLYEELTPSGDYWEENHMRGRLENAAKRCTRARMAEFLRGLRKAA